MSDAVKEVFVRLHEEGLIYRAQRLINWDPRLRTALSDLEVEHEERDGTLWSIAYPVKDSTERLVVATTRPETMLGDTAVAVHPDDLRYQELIGKTVVLPLVGRKIPIIADGILVDPKFGTGVVKVTPAHDHNDYATGLRHSLPMINIFTETAYVNENGGPYQGLERFAARKKVLEDLKNLELLVEEKPHKLPLAVSQRSGVPVEPRLSPQWYVKIKPLAEKAIEGGRSRARRSSSPSRGPTPTSWMRNIHDWCISRQLWWGHQIPAWYEASADGTVDFENAKFVVSRTKPEGNWVQDPDVLDTWFSSALWPFSTLGWPDKNAPDSEDLLPELGDGDRARHHLLLGRPHDDDGPALHGRRAVSHRLPARDGAGREGREDVEDQGQRHRSFGHRSGVGRRQSPRVGAQQVPPGPAADGRRRAALHARLAHPAGPRHQALDRSHRWLQGLLQQDLERHALRVDEHGRLQGRPEGVHQGTRVVVGRPVDSLAPRTCAVREVQTTRSSAYHFGEAASVLYQFLWREFCDWYIELKVPSIWVRN